MNGFKTGPYPIHFLRRIGIALLILAFVALLANPVTGESAQAAGPVSTLNVEVLPNKTYYRQREGFMIRATVSALQPVELCVYPNQPEANFSVTVYRQGYGKLNVVPNVVQLSPQEMARVKRVRLAPGQTRRMAFELKRLTQLPITVWQPGEYRVEAKFYLCGRTEGAEKPIPASYPVEFIVTD